VHWQVHFGGVINLNTCTVPANNPWHTDPGLSDWSDRYQSGEPNIDLQHKSIFHLIHAFMRAEGLFELHTCLEQLLQFLHFHFDYEETMMKALIFQDYEEHVRSHSQLLQRLLKLRQRISGDFLDKMEMNVFLKHWAYSHMPLADARFAEFLNFDGKRSAFL
jgi:hemerythrin